MNTLGSGWNSAKLRFDERHRPSGITKQQGEMKSGEVHRLAEDIRQEEREIIAGEEQMVESPI